MVFTTSSSPCLPNPHIHNLLLQSRQLPLPLPQQLASHLLQTQCSLLPSTNKTCKGKLFGMSTRDTAHSPEMPHANRLKNGSSAKHISQMCFSTQKTGGKKKYQPHVTHLGRLLLASLQLPASQGPLSDDCPSSWVAPASPCCLLDSTTSSRTFSPSPPSCFKA